MAAFDSNGPPVSAHANKLYRRLKEQVAGAGHEPNRERRLDLNSASYPAPVTEVIVVVGHVERTRPKTRVVYRENWVGSTGSAGGDATRTTTTPTNTSISHHRRMTTRIRTHMTPSSASVF